MADSNKTIFVTGDAFCDHHFYAGDNSGHPAGKGLGFREVRTEGGCLLIHKLIQSILTKHEGWQAECAYDTDFGAYPASNHSYTMWSLQQATSKPEKAQVWRTCDPKLGFGHRLDGGQASEGLKNSAKTCKPNILLIDDAGHQFRTQPFDWPDLNAFPDWILYKLLNPSKQNPVLAEVLTKCADRMVLLISADDIRTLPVRLGQGLSWESSVEDLLYELEGNPELAFAKKSRHLIITFRDDAALWIDQNPSTRRAVLVFESSGAEGEWEETRGPGNVYGYQSTFAASIIEQIVRSYSGPASEPNFVAAMNNGIFSCRKLWQIGHGSVLESKDAGKTPEFPYEEMAKAVVQEPVRFATAIIPNRIERRGRWMMLDELQQIAQQQSVERPFFDEAMAIAIRGPKALTNTPIATFGKYKTVDRLDIESLRSIRQLIRDYDKERVQPRPLNIAVFGPPGAGKSFGVKQIAKAVLGDTVPILTFNLSQFGGESDLVGALHQVRDAVLRGVTPVVFWDEFDSKSYDWLKLFLAPMQDGEFQEVQITHPVGKAVFVFAGATSSTFKEFGEPAGSNVSAERAQELHRQFVLAKGPDFKSRVVAYLNVLGPNPRLVGEKVDPTDTCYPIRRAFFVRDQLGVKEDQYLEMDRCLLRALLEVPKYEAGARSLEFICSCLRKGKRSRSDLPGSPLLDLHLDPTALWEICEREQPYHAMAHELAAKLHEQYRLRIKDVPERKNLDCEFELLPEEYKESNFDQALRIIRNLAIAGLKLEEGDVVRREDLSASRTQEDQAAILLLEQNVDLIAEAEHNGWMLERISKGWTYAPGKKDEVRKTHPLLVPYGQLSEDHKNFDRWSIVGRVATDSDPAELGYVDLVKTVGFRVVCS